MKKLLRGIVDFRNKAQPEYKENFGQLATGQDPDCLFIACSDSRVVPNTFASTNPGDLFVIRNVGNIIPCCSGNGMSSSDESEAAAIEFSVHMLSVKDIVVCGHSECGAMKALLDGREHIQQPHLKSWLRHAEESLTHLKENKSLDSSLSTENQLSQLNVLNQMRNIQAYPEIQRRVQEKTLWIHGWWFDVSNADVYFYDQSLHKFVIIDEEQFHRISKSLAF